MFLQNIYLELLNTDYINKNIKKIDVSNCFNIVNNLWLEKYINYNIKEIINEIF